MPKSKPFREMTVAELEAETQFWLDFANGAKGPGTPSNSAREGAMRLYQEAAAWLHRRASE